MGNNGSITTKARICKSLLIFTKWYNNEINDLLKRSNLNLIDKFSLNKNEFDYLINIELVGYINSLDLYNNIFSSKVKTLYNSQKEGILAYFSSKYTSLIHNEIDSSNDDKIIKQSGVVDKFEVICVIILASKLSDVNKIEYLFDLFNFNEKGYLLRDELVLLVMSVSNGVYKSDPTLLKPSIKICNIIVNHAMNNFTEVDKTHQTIRRPELIKFCINSLYIRGFLDAWRGHSSQVLLDDNELWKDSSFPASNLSITSDIQNNHNIGLPPNDFIIWLRSSKIKSFYNNALDQNKNQMKKLFTHSTSILKTVDKTIQYHGFGLLGSGNIQRNFLSDKWLCHAIACVCSKPSLYMKLFLSTEQEKHGRYCCQFFEGLNWRLLFVDDRIPCTINQLPLFTSSSDINELNILILEKCLAKYFNSYYNISVVNDRKDAFMYGLRLLSGGHVTSCYTKDFVWTSGNYNPNVTSTNQSNEAKQHLPNGYTYIATNYHNSCIISFGRSENNFNNKDNYLPNGFIYPLISIQLINNYKYFIFKDFYSNLSYEKMNRYVYLHENHIPDNITGYCNTFRIKVDDIMNYFDIIYVVKYPDLLRNNVITSISNESTNWLTQCISAKSNHISNPAIFELNLFGKIKSTKLNNYTNRYNNSKLLNKSNEIKQLDKLFDAVLNNDEDTYTTEQSTNQSTNQSPIHNDEYLNIPVELSFTICSSMEWSVAGSDRVNPVIRVVIIPSYETKQIITNYINTPSNEQNLPLSGYIPTDDGFYYEIRYIANRCWYSDSINLLPGRYYIFSSITYDLSYNELYKLVIPNNISNFPPWLADRHPNDHFIDLHMSSYSNYQLSTPKANDIPINNVDLNDLTLDDINCNDIPFLFYESQSNITSNSLMKLLNILQDEAILIKSEYYLLFDEFNKLKLKLNENPSKDFKQNAVNESNN